MLAAGHRCTRQKFADAEALLQQAIEEHRQMQTAITVLRDTVLAGDARLFDARDGQLDTGG